MVSDEEPRYRLKNPSTGDIVGTLFVDSGGTLELQEGTSGSENALSLETNGNVSLKRMNNRSYHAGNYPTLQDAVDAASTSSAAGDGGVVFVPPGTFDPVTVSERNVTIIGTGPSATSVDSTTGDPAISINNNRVHIRDLRALSGSGASIEVAAGGDVPFGFGIENCRCDDGIEVATSGNDARFGRIIGNFMSFGTITMGADSQQNAVVGNTTATLSKNGSNNSFAGNT